MTTLLTALLLLGARPAAAQAPCQAPGTTNELNTTLTRAETAFGELNVEPFMEAMDEAIYLIPCLGEALDQSTAARVHRLQGIRQFVASEEARASQAFGAARAADPAYVLPTWLVPEGHAVRDLYGSFPLENASTETVAAPLSGSLRFDGVEGLERPTRWPTLVQVLEPSGRPMATAYLYPGDAMPTYPMAKPPPGAVAEVGTGEIVPAGPSPRRKLGFAIGGVGILSGIAAGALYGAAAAAASDFEADHPAWTRDDLVASQGRANALVISSGSAAALALGAGATAFILVRW